MTATATAQPEKLRRSSRYATVGWIAAAAIMIGAAVLRFHALAAKSFWTDEGVSVAFARLDWFNLGRILWRREANMAFYYLLLRGWLNFGSSEEYVRALSVLFAVATIPFVYLIGKRLFGQSVGLTAAALLAVNAFHVRYSQEARSYSLVMLLVVVSSWFFVRCVENPTRKNWIGYVISSALAVYAHFFGVLVIAAHWASAKYLPAGHLPRKDWHRSLRWIGLATLPIWLFIATTGAGPVSWIKRPSLGELHAFMHILAGNGGDWLLLLYLLCAAIALFAFFQTWRSHKRSLESWRYALLLDWFAVPLFVTLIFSFLRPVFLTRYMIVCLPGFVLFAAAGLWRVKPRLLAAPLLAAMLVLGVIGVQSYYQKDFDILREDWRGASSYVIEHANAGDAIFFYRVQGRMPYEYYISRSQPQNRPMVIYPSADPGRTGRISYRDFMGSPNLDFAKNAAERYPRIWLVLSQNIAPSGIDETTRLLEAALAQSHRIAASQQFSGVKVVLFER